MSNVFGNKNIPGMQATDGEEEGDEMNIYSNVDDIKSHDVCRGTEDTKRNQTSQHTGSESKKNRSLRSVLVCLVVLCVLLLTAVIVLCVLIYTNNHQCHINNKNITQERDQLLTNNTKLTAERDQLLTNNTKLTAERDELRVKYDDVNKLSEQLKQEKGKLLKQLHDGWIYYQSSIYYISTEKKSWDQSRSYCRERGADLVIINNKEEQKFVCQLFAEEIIWIGLSDSEEEGRWKWVDGSTLTISFWGDNEPGGHRRENCVVKHFSLWLDYPCTDAFKCICEKKHS